MNLYYLWFNREVASFLSKRFFKIWAKRLLNLPSLLSISFRIYLYKLKGLKIGTLSILGELDLNGSISKLNIGESSFISTGVHLALHESINIGSYVVINTGVQLLTGTHNVSSPNWELIKKPIFIKDYAWIAQSAIIMPGVTIGKFAVVGAGAVVRQDVPDFSIAIGNPAFLIEKKRSDDCIYRPVNTVACVEAWLGTNIKKSIKEKWQS